METAEDLKWLRALADKQNKTWAQVYLGLLHDLGTDVRRDYRKARYWYKRAAEGGDEDAALWLADLLDEGKGGRADPRAAVRWWKRLAERGNRHAQYNLGLFHVKVGAYHATIAQPCDGTPWQRAKESRWRRTTSACCCARERACGAT